MSLKPLGDGVIVRKPEEKETTRASGLILTDSSATGDGLVPVEVVAVGRGRVVDGQTIPVEVSVGDTVYVSRYAGTTVSVDGEELTYLHERDIAAVVA